MDEVMTDTRNEKTQAGGTLIKVLSFTAEKTVELAASNSVVGERIVQDGITVIPISKLSVGFAGGGADVTDGNRKKKQNPAGAGAKVTVTPLTFLVIEGGNVRLMNITAENPHDMNRIVADVVRQAKRLFEAAKEKKEKNKK